MAKIIEIVSASAGYNNEIILKDINLEISDRDFVGIIGPNGGGKTTLLKLLLGELKPIKGKVKRCSKKPNESLFGYLPQNTNIDKQFPITVNEVVLSGLLGKKGVTGRYTKNDKQLALDVLQRIGITDLKNKPIGELSGGQLQRVLLSRALISNPRLLVLDEPNTYVDNRFEKELYELLKELNKEMAIVMVSHDMGTITSHVKTIACVNRTLHYHPSNKISNEQLAAYDCPIQVIAHGPIPHTILGEH
ncbi:MAG TPA: ABC transporter ATP-binding protein [Perlabentimonas sp.]|jgi:zinc transport system ATP-binding protein|nr:ABC transporter ATP-binding protein [Bacteroidales bacterium]MDY0348428.1 ABC transporter ATP-binding protein [Tenuifilaceae bacterium]HZJ74835.1 ABC transporter ATP-binding protein [Perlabentimonas sp.]